MYIVVIPFIKVRTKIFFSYTVQFSWSNILTYKNFKNAYNEPNNDIAKR